ncbi:MAG TPA: hypothetical protein VMU77_00395, partial [Acidimicrobiales bacterium]|nr:hypothetical protein [Acidimicrobiales bacterium]
MSSSFPSGSKGFRLSVSANVPGFDWKYYANGLIEYTTSRASEIQTAQGGNPYTLSQKVSTQLYPVLNTVFAHSEIYLQKWGLYLTLFPGQKQPWISVSATDTMSGTTNAKSTLFSVALSDPFVYLDTILKGSTGEKFIRNSTVSGHTDRLYQGKLNLPKVASALPGLEAGLVNILNLTGGTGPTTMKLWVAPDGKVDQLQMSQNNHIPFVATIAF